MEHSSFSLRGHLVPYFVAAYAVSWAFWIPAALTSRGVLALPFPVTPLVVVGTFGPSIAAFVLTALTQGRVGTWHLLRRGFDHRIPVWVLLPVLTVPVAVALVAALIVGGRRTTPDPLALTGTFVLFFFFGGSFGEEFGWRGFALPRLQDRWGALTASMILGILWGGWHLPLFWLPGTTQATTPLWLYLVFTAAFSVSFTWVYNNTDGNLLAALLLHTVFNMTVVIFPPPDPVGGIDQSMYYTTALFVVIAALLVALYGPRQLRRATTSRS